MTTTETKDSKSLTEDPDFFSPGRLGEFREKYRLHLREEHGSSVKVPMSPECRVAVLIPVYNESVGTLLRPLLSLSRQEGVAPEDFEVVLVVNNSRQEAQDRTPAFLANQEALTFARYLNQPDYEKFSGWNAGLLAAADEIRSSKIKVFAVDKSSLEFAEEQNHVTHARNRGFLELANRFFSVPAGATGLVAMTDADCRFSGNYIKAILDVYSAYPYLNGLAGSVEQELDEDLPYPEILKRAFEIHYNYPLLISWAENYPGKIAFRRLHNLYQQVLETGQDMVIPIKSWILVGGVPNTTLGGEDHQFGRHIADLPGEVAVCAHYRIFPLLRVSDRAGMGSYGRRVKQISRSVVDYMEGRSGRVMIPDLKKYDQFFQEFLRAAEKRELTGCLIYGLMTKHNCNVEGLNLADLGSLAIFANREMSKKLEKKNLIALEKEILKHLDGRFPERDITGLVFKDGQPG